MLAAGAAAEARLTCRRGGELLAVTIDVKAKPRPDGKRLTQSLFGMALREITPQTARSLNLPLDSGLLVVEIDAGSPADAIGLKLKDVIFQLGNFYVTDLTTLGLLLEDFKPGQLVKIGVARGNVAAWVQIGARRPAPAPRPGLRRPPVLRPGRTRQPGNGI